MRESVIKASLRLFFLTLSVVFGAFFAFILLAMMFGSLSETNEGQPEINYRYDPQIVPNANNARKVLSSSYPVILKINIHGEIGTEDLNRTTIDNMLVESRERSLKDDRVKAVILHINTPGGTVIDANAIYQALKEYKLQYKTPIYAFVDGLCASGGMYVACATDKIYATDVSIIGSVGVILGPFMNVYKLMETFGIQSETITAGKGKDEMNPLREWKPNESANLKKVTDYMYDHFIHVVASNRPLITKEQLQDVYGANIFDANTALQYGYIDGISNSFNDTLTLLAKEIGIDDDMYQVVEFTSNNWLKTLFSSKANLGLLTGEVKHSLKLPAQLNPEFMNQPLYLYQQNR